MAAIDARINALSDDLKGPVSERTRKLENRTKQLEERLKNFEQAWNQQLPAFLNSVTSVGAFGHELGQQRDQLARIYEHMDRQRDQSAQERQEVERELARQRDRQEFIRSEIMFEMKYAADAGAPGTGHKEAVEPRVVNETKLQDALKEGLRINLGCGHVPLNGYINVDMRALPNVDIVAEVGDLPLQKGLAQEVFSAHVLEHFPQEEMRRKLLPYWRDLLASGGTFRAIVPDAEAMIAKMASGEYSFEEFREVFFGLQEYEGDFHFNMFTPASLRILLEEAGFKNIEVPVQGRRNGKCYEFEIRAVRP
ncbi:hypothetical protein MHY87_05940 [Microvirga sp. ACRRW]|uniref:class I SAM-dependent methyltransferase n=1 Tax=Microvirga sp. ACRRW TaxID=2918205 RepID=UPI001EF4A395|nr:hypothetical protein [Microvirga sp. ACRRW]MCG7392443.1 hypothetical protein [Microvirga sp. ACRRW]